MEGWGGGRERVKGRMERREGASGGLGRREGASEGEGWEEGEKVKGRMEGGRSE